VAGEVAHARRALLQELGAQLDAAVQLHDLPGVAACQNLLAFRCSHTQVAQVKHFQN